MRRHGYQTALAAIAALCLLGGCATPAVSGSEKHRVALVAKSTDTAFWKSVFAGAEAAAAEYNLDLTITGPETEEDYETQNAMVAQVVADGAEAVVFSAIDHENNVSAIDAASDAGAKIVTIDSSVDSDAVRTYIGTDNYAAGQQAAQAALNCRDDSLQVGLVNYDINSANGQQRELGARDTLNNDSRAVIVDGINVAAAADSAYAGVAALLRVHPEINLLIAFNEPVSIGAARALTDLGLEEAVSLVAFDGNVETVDGLQSGAVDSLILQNPYAMGYLGVESAYRLLNGQLPEPTVDTSTVTVTLDNLFSENVQRALFSFAES